MSMAWTPADPVLNPWSPPSHSCCMLVMSREAYLPYVQACAPGDLHAGATGRGFNVCRAAAAAAVTATAIICSGGRRPCNMLVVWVLRRLGPVDALLVPAAGMKRGAVGAAAGLGLRRKAHSEWSSWAKRGQLLLGLAAGADGQNGGVHGTALASAQRNQGQLARCRGGASGWW